MSKNNPGHGGARSGAGRPAKYVKVPVGQEFPLSLMAIRNGHRIIKIDREERSVNIWNGTMKLTPSEACRLMEELNEHARELYDMARPDPS